MTAGGFGAGAKQHLYAEKLAEYQRYYGQHPVCNPLLVEFVPPTAKRILDIGCNMGGAGRLLRQRGFQGEIWGGGNPSRVGTSCCPTLQPCPCRRCGERKSLSATPAWLL